jgi:predicted nucleic acid-binding Zn ribbon protein
MIFAVTEKGKNDMARYIDANILKEKILEERDKIPLYRVERYSFGVELPNRDGQAMRGGIRKALRCLEQMPTADVAPRAKIAREICSKICREINDALQSNYKVLPQIEQSEALWNRVSGKIDALRGIDGFIADLLEEYMIREISNEEKCLVCGEVIPEGRQVCPNCEEGGDN